MLLPYVRDTLPFGFEFSEATGEDLEGIFIVLENALISSACWVLVTKDCDLSEVYSGF
jgi:hypothetical protein